MKARTYLRSVTREAHDRVDSKLSAFDLSDADGYADFLASQAAAFLAVEAALDQAGAAALLPDWQERRRSHALISDLVKLGRDVPVAALAPNYDDEASIWGGLYVIEGSRLGGAVLRKSVPQAFPQTFLGSGAKGAWPALVAELERNLDDDVVLRRAGSSAVDTFACFESSYGKGVSSQ